MPSPAPFLLSIKDWIIPGFFKFIFSIELYLTYNTVLVSGVQQDD